jgi:hypothetical protein
LSFKHAHALLLANTTHDEDHACIGDLASVLYWTELFLSVCELALPAHCLFRSIVGFFVLHYLTQPIMDLLLSNAPAHRHTLLRCGATCRLPPPHPKGYIRCALWADICITCRLHCCWSLCGPPTTSSLPTCLCIPYHASPAPSVPPCTALHRDGVSRHCCGLLPRPHSPPLHVRLTRITGTCPSH